MTKDRLPMISASDEAANHAPQPKRSTSSKHQLREETQAKFERMWLIDPEQFNPMRNAMERERITRTLSLLEKYLTLAGKQIADLGCGDGTLAILMAQKGAFVHAIDIAHNALKKVKEKNQEQVTSDQDYIPKTKLQEDFYNAAISTDVIAYLPHDLFRLYVSELSRIINSEGYVLCSTPIDINSEDALQRFADLAETEFLIKEWVFSYHALYLRMERFLTAPERFVRAWLDREYKLKELERRKGISRWWFRMNTTALPVGIWNGVKFLLKPIIKFYQQSHNILNVLEKVCRFFWSDAGISHAIFIGTRRPLVIPASENIPPVERKQKKQVWE